MNVKSKIQITHGALVALLQGIAGTVFASLVSVTDARLRKTGNPLALPVVKISVVSNATIGADYGAAVNREADRQAGSAEFEAGALPKGRAWLVPGKVLQSTEEPGKYYLRTQSTPGQRRKQRAKVVGYRQANGVRATRAQVAPFAPPVRESSKQQDSTGISGTVWVRDYLFTSLALVKINGQTYEVTP